MNPLGTDCPTCDAKAGERCKGIFDGTPMEAEHTTRIVKAAQISNPPKSTANVDPLGQPYDHRDEAMKCIRSAHIHVEADDRPGAELLMQQAQVHAMLAQADQTRRVADLLDTMTDNNGYRLHVRID